MIYYQYFSHWHATCFNNSRVEENFSQGLKRMKVKKILRKNMRTIGIGGVIASWITIGSVWSGFGTAALVGYFVTGGLFSLVIIAERI